MLHKTWKQIILKMLRLVCFEDAGFVFLSGLVGVYVPFPGSLRWDEDPESEMSSSKCVGILESSNGR